MAEPAVYTYTCLPPTTTSFEKEEKSRLTLVSMSRFAAINKSVRERREREGESYAVSEGARAREQAAQACEASVVSLWRAEEDGFGRAPDQSKMGARLRRRAGSRQLHSRSERACPVTRELSVALVRSTVFRVPGDPFCAVSSGILLAIHHHARHRPTLCSRPADEFCCALRISLLPT